MPHLNKKPKLNDLSHKYRLLTGAGKAPKRLIEEKFDLHSIPSTPKKVPGDNVKGEKRKTATQGTKYPGHSGTFFLYTFIFFLHHLQAIQGNRKHRVP